MSLTVSPILAIPLTAPDQTNKTTTQNDGILALEAATQGQIPVSFAISNEVTLSAAQYTRAAVFVCSGQTAAGTLTIPLTQRVFTVRNNSSSESLTVGGPTGLTVVLAAGSTGQIECDGTNCIVFASGGPGPQGSIGVPGSIGLTGSTGLTGLAGSLWHTGTGVPPGTLGVNTDLYLDVNTGNVYQNAAGTYDLEGNIIGPPGTPGTPGAPGSIGPAGTVAIDVLASVFLNGGSIGNPGTISSPTIAAQSLIGNPGGTAAAASLIPVGGNLGFSGGSLVIEPSPTFAVVATTAPLVINANSVVALSGLTGSVEEIFGKDGELAQIVIHGYGSNARLVGYQSGGTQAAPTATSNSNNLFQYSGAGYNGTAWVSGTGLNMLATENWTPTNNGSGLNFNTINTGTTVATTKLSIRNVVMIGTTVQNGLDNLQVVGGATIDIANITTLVAGHIAQQPYIVAGSTGATPFTASQIILAHCFGIAVTFPVNFGATPMGPASSGGSFIDATASAVINIDHCPAADDPTVSGSWTTVGTMTMAAGGHTATFATVGGGTPAFATGDFMRWIGPTTPDTTLALFGATLAGTRA